jgi:hypothetical protein
LIQHVIRKAKSSRSILDILTYYVIAMKSLLSLIMISWMLCGQNLVAQQDQEPGTSFRDIKTGGLIRVYRESRALLIGIDKYHNANRLDYAVADAKALKRMLIETCGFKERNIVLLTDEQATKANIEDEFDRLTRVPNTDRVIVFIAGHGMTIDLATGGEMGFIVPVDGQPTIEGIYTTCIPMSRVKEISDLSRAKHMLFLIDACYGGLAATTRPARIVPEVLEAEFIKKLTNERARQIITAGGRGEQVVEKAEWGHSAFTRELLEGIGKGFADQDNNGLIFASELANYLQKEVSYLTDNKQTPKFRYLSDDEGEFLFVVPKTAPEVAPPLESSYGEVFVNSVPDSADVYFDGQKTDKTTPILLKDVSVGNHFIELRKSKLIAGRTFAVLPGQLSKVDLTLELGKGSIKVLSVPAGPDTWVDNQGFGDSAVIANLSPGLHKVKFTKAGYLDDSTEVEVRPFEQSVVNIKLKLPSSLVISSSPSGLVTYLGDEPLGRTPLTASKLPPGEFTVRILAPDTTYNDWQQTIQLAEGSTREIDAPLVRRSGFLDVLTSRDIDVYVDSQKVATGAVENYRIVVGRHTIEFLGPSSSRLSSMTIDVSSGVKRRIEARFGVFSLGSLWRSVLIPGWGQFHDGSNLEGWVFLLGTLGAGGYSAFAQTDYSKKVDDYDHTGQAYLAATTTDEAVRLRQDLLTKYSSVDRISRARNIAFVSTAVIYGLNVLDALLFHSSKDEVRILAENSTPRIQPMISQGPYGVRWGMQINF